MPNSGFRLQAFGSEAQARRVTGYRIKKSFHFCRRRAGYTLIELLVVLDSLERQIRGATNVVDKDFVVNVPLDNYIMLERKIGNPLHIACIRELTDNYKSRIAVREDPRPNPTFTEFEPGWRSISN